MSTDKSRSKLHRDTGVPPVLDAWELRKRFVEEFPANFQRIEHGRDATVVRDTAS
jgi:hypothetical protein